MARPPLMQKPTTGAPSPAAHRRQPPQEHLPRATTMFVGFTVSMSS
jgi:hypothetical protein